MTNTNQKSDASSAVTVLASLPVPIDITQQKAGLSIMTHLPDKATVRIDAPLRVFTNGQRVAYVGITGRADGPTGRVVRQYKSGVRVRWDDGRVETVHPEDIKVRAQ